MTNKIIFLLFNIYLIKCGEIGPYQTTFDEWDLIIEEIKSNHHDCLDNLKAFIMLHKKEGDNINHMLHTFFYTAIMHNNRDIKDYFRYTFYDWYMLLEKIESCHPDCLANIHRFVRLHAIQRDDIQQVLKTFLQTAITYQNHEAKVYLSNVLHVRLETP
ncbi:hypothetical protein A3F66_02510 [candidate division TM6 bacterium RIFCSPHIGHO2_12_FULL_32_22]|nr:MAG: hypothetical protein A3F66_02510 [candidate division TM6 bacterium RIFCSPHIGHO2_12_FULL_32_22]